MHAELLKSTSEAVNHSDQSIVHLRIKNLKQFFERLAHMDHDGKLPLFGPLQLNPQCLSLDVQCR